MITDRFHPLVARWFTERFGTPTEPQEAGWPEIAAGNNTLIAAPTGSGKTLTAFLWSIDRLIRQAEAGELPERTQVVYVSPLKALGNDIQKNLMGPLEEIGALAEAEGTPLPEIRVFVRSGDTPMHERQKMINKPPHILITTPESFYILLTAEKSRRFLKEAETVIVDEIHAVAGDKRGSHLTLSLERLDLLCQRPLQRIGLSATQKPIEAIASLLVGEGCACAIADVGHRRKMDLSIEVPGQDLGPIASNEMAAETYDRIAQHINRHRTTLVFVHTRRLAERVSHALSERLGEDRVAAHHGSLSRRTRLSAERRLKSGDLAAVVATASLELGIDIGDVDLVCQIGAPRTLSQLIQRVGRAGHWRGAIPKGIFFPLTRDELLQCAAGVHGVRSGELDQIEILENGLDILAQQIIATVASEGEIEEKVLRQMVKRAYPYRSLSKKDFDSVLEMVSEGVSTTRGRRSAYVHHDRVNGQLRPRRGARLAAITSGGAIPDTADYRVIEHPAETFVGTVDEDFAIESNAGDIFLLGNHSWRVKRVEQGVVRVEDAHGAPPSVPFWFGEAPARTVELSASVSSLRKRVEEGLGSTRGICDWLIENCGVTAAGAEQILDYVHQTKLVLGGIPAQETIFAERFFDESGGMQVVIHSPYGGRINRAWGFALRKRFCVTFDFELQAAATDDGIVLSLGTQHSFPLESVFRFVRIPSLEKDTTISVLQSPLFPTRWRWNATRALAIPRFSGGRRVPVHLQRMRAEDLIAAVFPDQLGCQDNRAGPVTPPDHPLVNDVLQDCLHEAMDLDGLRELLGRIESGEVRTVAVETPMASAMSHEILSARPYAFVDDAPLEERRTRAVMMRRVTPDLEDGMGALDEAAINEVRTQAWPDVRDADELHDFLHSAGLAPEEEVSAWQGFAEDLIAAGRAVHILWQDAEGKERRGYAAIDRIPMVCAGWESAETEPENIMISSTFSEEEAPTKADSDRAFVRAWMECVGPITASQLAQRMGLELSDVKIALAMLEGEGTVLQGRFTPDLPEEEIEWCDRALLSRIHRLTLGRLRKEIEPVTASNFIRFLLRWQHVHPGTQLHGREGILEVIEQLQGLELPAPAWEARVLPLRVKDYDPDDLEQLCLAGLVTWGRIEPGALLPSEEEVEAATNGNGRKRRRAPTRVAPLALLLREAMPALVRPGPTSEETKGSLSPAAQTVLEFLETRGASFLLDISNGTDRLKTEVEEALWELVARGLVNGDGIAGLRALLMTDEERKKKRRLRPIQGGRAQERFMPVGRWSLWRTEGAALLNKEERLEAFARQLLRRWGVVLRELAVRESHAFPWRELVGVFRRLEARGEIRGGRFVKGFVGEQFAQPEAVEALRAVRRTQAEDETAIVPSADPLNLVGVLTPGPRVSAYTRQVIRYQNGVPSDIDTLGAVRSRFENERLKSEGLRAEGE